jgi:hypothetical protein
MSTASELAASLLARGSRTERPGRRPERIAHTHRVLLPIERAAAWSLALGRDLRRAGSPARSAFAHRTARGAIKRRG